MTVYVYILKGANGRHYIGTTNDLERRLQQHRSGHTHTTKRLGGEIELVANAAFATRKEALSVERRLKRWKSPAKAIAFLENR